METKQCTNCKEIKLIDEFYKHKGQRFGVGHRCKKCVSAIDKERYELINKVNPKYKKKVKEYGVKWYQENKERVCSERRLKNHALRELCINHYGGKCDCCGENKYEFLVFDHINGGGNQHRINGDGRKIVRYLIKNNYPDGFRVLCHNCNNSLGHYGYCPHDKENII